MGVDRILVAVGSDDAGSADHIGEAIADVADPVDATVTLVHVFTRERYDAIRENVEDHPHDVAIDAVADRHATIRSVGDRLTATGINWDARGAIGDPGPAVLEVATEIAADLLVVGGTNHSPTADAVVGSTTSHLLREAPCPVVIVGRPEHES